MGKWKCVPIQEWLLLLGFGIDFISDMDGVILEPLSYEVGFKLQVPSGDRSEDGVKGS